VPLTPEQREQIVDLAKLGRGRNEIARTVGCSPTTVTKVAKANKVNFDGSITATATSARAADAKARRTALGLDMLGDLEGARLRLEYAGTARDFQLTAQGIDALSRAYANLLKLDPGDGGMTEARGLMAGFFAAVGRASDPLPADAG
jgi:hypothetical protein